MRTRRPYQAPLAAALSLAALAGPARAGEAREKLGVYEYVVEGARGTVDGVSEALAAAVANGGWKVLAQLNVGVPKDCRYTAHVLAVVDPSYVHAVMAANPKTAPFALVDRIDVFEDEAGVHVAIVNHESISRTVLMDDRAQVDAGRAHQLALRAIVAGAVTGRASEREYGEVRSRGYIGRTMGVMAGGPFGEKVKDEVTIPGTDWRSVAAKIRDGLARPGPKWGLHVVYDLELPEHETMIFGSTGAAMEAKSFSIVRSGADSARDKYQCPGLAHAAAYPIEIVVARDGDSVKVRIVDTMYRMKMYFEDAGKWAFMKNMGMPGSIHDELAAQIASALKRPSAP
jgi:hypothetical protein